MYICIYVYIYIHIHINSAQEYNAKLKDLNLSMHDLNMTGDMRQVRVRACVRASVCACACARDRICVRACIVSGAGARLPLET